METPVQGNYDVVMREPAVEIDQFIQTLRDFGDVKVWSVIVTVLGDRFRHGPDGLGGPALTQILNALSIKPSALRVALHRLSNDGWLDIEKHGRTSFYKLSQMGQTRTADVSELVFSSRLPRQNDCFLALAARDMSDKAPECAVQIARRIWVTRTRPQDPDFLVASLDGQPLPPWVQASLVPDRQAASFRQLSQLLATTSVVPEELTEDDRTTLRILILHHWRRLVLRHPETIWYILGDEWDGARCRTKVVDWLDRLAPKSGASGL